MVYENERDRLNPGGDDDSDGPVPPKEQELPVWKGVNMTALARRYPFKELDESQNRLRTLFGPAPVPPENDKETNTGVEWAPLVDITEDATEFLIKAELPDVKMEDVKVTVEDGVLAISGERKFEKEEKERKYHRMERAYGSVLSSFTLPGGADAGTVSGELREGVLTIRLQRTEKARAKAVEVKVS